MIEQFSTLPGRLTAANFKKLYGSSTYWVAFRVNEADAKLRIAERETLHALLDRSSAEQAPDFLRVLAPWHPWAYLGEAAKTCTLKKQLRDECVEQLMPKVEHAFVASMKQPECIRRLNDVEYAAPFSYLLFSASRLPWSGLIRHAIFQSIAKAKSDAVEYEKISDLLGLLLGAQNGSSPIRPESVALLVADEELMSALWRGVTSRQIQFRMRNSYLAKRRALLDLGVPEHVLPLTSELEAASQSQSPGSD